ncbi:hypothetical protein BC629DRAFT_1300104, partial [Irpex lacteus]
LHPRYKTEYFRRQKWKASWIRTAEDLVREQWTKHYCPADPTPRVAANTSASQTDSVCFIINLSNSITVDTIEQYLATPTWPNVSDPLQWWNSQLAGGDEMSIAAARMALDFLSAPGKSLFVVYIV